MRRILIIISILLTIGIAGCKQTEKTEAVTAGIEAAQMEGRNAARGFLNKQWIDSTDMARDLAAIDSIRRAYSDTALGTAFYRTFRSTLQTTRPDLATQLK